MSRRNRVLRPTVVVFVLAALVSCATAAQASNWATGLQASSKGQARADVAPTVPAGVAAACVSSTTKQIKVSWGSVPHATYTVYRATAAAGPFSVLASGLAASPYTSTFVNGTYWFQVQATVGTAGTNWKSANSAATPTGRVISGTTSPSCV
jgi:hypothetical protein